MGERSLGFVFQEKPKPNSTAQRNLKESVSAASEPASVAIYRMSEEE